MIVVADEELLLWVNDQLKAGYTLESIKQSLLDSNYNLNDIEKVLSEIQTNNIQTTQISTENTDQETTTKQNKLEQKEPLAETSAFKIGAYSGVTASIATITLVYALVFFDYLRTIETYGILIGFIATFTIANRSYNSNFKKVFYSSVVSYVILGISTIAASLFTAAYLFNTSILNLLAFDSTKQNIDVLNLMPGGQMTFGLIVGFFMGIITFAIINAIIKIILKKINLRKINVLTPVLVIAFIVFLGITLYSFSGEKIPAYTENISHCIGTENFSICDTEELFDRGMKPVTGYTSKSYFLATPNTNNLFKMNKYSVTTTLLTMENMLLIDQYCVYLKNNFKEESQSKIYKNRIINNVDFKLDELETIKETNPLNAINLCFKTYNSYLTETKKLVTEQNSTTNSLMDTETKNANLKFIDNRIKTNIGLKEKNKHISFNNSNNIDKTFYKKYKFDFLNDAINLCIRFNRQESSYITIKNVNIENQKLTLTVKNEGVYEFEKTYDTEIYVDGLIIHDKSCDFEQLDVGEEGVCTGTIKNNTTPTKKIKFVYGTDSAEYNYE